MTIEQLFSWAKDYRGEDHGTTDPFTSDCQYPYKFSLNDNPLDILAKRLRYAKYTSFEHNGTNISNTSSDGNSLLSPSHTTHDGGSACWSNNYSNMIDYTIFLMNVVEIIRSSRQEWTEIQKYSSSMLDYWFAIKPSRIAIHYKKLKDGFELEIMNPFWIAGYISQ